MSTPKIKDIIVYMAFHREVGLDWQRVEALIAARRRDQLALAAGDVERANWAA